MGYQFTLKRSSSGRFFVHCLNGPYYLSDVFTTEVQALEHIAKHGQLAA